MAAGKTAEELAEIAGRLHVSTVDVRPIEIDWNPSGSGYAEDGAALYWEALDYTDDDGEDWRLIAHDGAVVAVVIDDQIFDRYFDYAELVEEPILTEEHFDSLMVVEPYAWGSEGPMMNYWYPIEETDSYLWGGSFDPITAAASLADVPLCVVNVDGAYGLALTGGGMDLSWEICAAFVALGKCPPAHFADLPRMAMEYGEQHRLTVAAMRRSLEIRAARAARALESLDELEAFVGGAR